MGAMVKNSAIFPLSNILVSNLPEYSAIQNR